MGNASESNTIKLEFTVPIPADIAFDLFTKELHSWWPKEYTWAGDVLGSIEIEPGVNGRCFERGPHNFECDWGRVLIWDPPKKIAFTWQISPNRVPEPNPDKVSEIDVLFEKEAADETLVTFIHRNFEKHGEDSEAQFTRIHKRNIHMLKYYEGEEGDNAKMELIDADFNHLKSKALLAGIFMLFNEKGALLNLDEETKGIILIGLKSLIECFEEVIYKK